MLKIFAETEHHIAVVKILPPLTIDQGLDHRIKRIDFTHHNTWANRTRTIEVLLQTEFERPGSTVMRALQSPSSVTPQI